MYEHTEQALATTPRSQTSLLLDNVSKIERECGRVGKGFPTVSNNPLILIYTAYKDQIDKSRFVFKLVQAARSRKTKNKSNRKSTISSMTSDTMSIDSSSTVSVPIDHPYPNRFLPIFSFHFDFHRVVDRIQGRCDAKIRRHGR